jgi:hypothetical protein
LEDGDPRLFSVAEDTLHRERIKHLRYEDELKKPNITEKHKSFLEGKFMAIDQFEREVDEAKRNSMRIYAQEMRQTDEALGKSRTPSPDN